MPQSAFTAGRAPVRNAGVCVSRTDSAGEHSFERLVERLISAGDVEHPMRGALVVQQPSQHGGDVITRDRASAGHRAHAYASGARVIGECARSQDRPFAIARLHGGVGVCLGAEVDAESVVTVGRVLCTARADGQVARDASAGSRAEQLDRTASVHRQRPCGAATASGPGGKHCCVGTFNRGGDLLLARALEIAEHRGAPALADVLCLVGVSDQPDDAVAVGGQQPREA
jgi:hypothetical protein